MSGQSRHRENLDFALSKTEFGTDESLKEKAYSLVGRPDDLQWEDQVVAILEARDGTILDVVRKIKPYDPDND